MHQVLAHMQSDVAVGAYEDGAGGEFGCRVGSDDDGVAHRHVRQPATAHPSRACRPAAAGEARAHAERELATLIITALRDQARGGDRLTLFAEDPVTRR
jgi:hypothetical protein